MPSGCIHGAKCQYDHSKAPPPKKAQPDAKAKSTASVPKVPAAVAIIAALSSMVAPSQSLGTLEWCADTGAGRHLISYEALRDQGFQYDAVSNFENDSHENIRLNFRQVVVRRTHLRRLDLETMLVS